MTVQLAKMILDLELELLQPEVRRSGGRLNEMLADEFFEFGESGIRYTKQEILEQLPHRANVRYSVREFDIHEVAADIVLATYLTEKENADTGERATALRSSLWRNRNGHWKMVFHQGTRLDESQAGNTVRA